MTIQEIYERYRIMPALQLHQLRAGGVARLVCEARGDVAHPERPIVAALFHDMGNILKSDLSVFPEFLEPQGRDYWQRVKDDFLATYGESEHDATIAIAEEVGLPSEVFQLITQMGFSRSHDILANGSVELKVLEYADQRVAPWGVASLEERLADGRRRYLKRHGADYAVEQRIFDTNAAGVRGIEAYLFRDLSIMPADITEAAVSKFFEEFRGYEITGGKPL